nr:STAS domain-containing protein [Kibdelosporangium phytohabitans]
MTHTGTEGDDLVTTVTVTGEIDVTNAEDLARTLAGITSEHPLVLDLSELCYFDSAGFAVLDRVLSEGPVIVVLTPGSKLRKAATLMGLPYHDDAGTAQAEARGQALP